MIDQKNLFEKIKTLLSEIKKDVSSSCWHVIDVHLTRSLLGIYSSQNEGMRILTRAIHVGTQLFRDPRDADAPRSVELRRFGENDQWQFSKS